MPFEPRENIYLRMPKVGESYDFSQHGKITEIKKMDNKEHKFSKFNFMQNKTETLLDKDGNPREVVSKEDLGYFYRITFEDGKILQLSDWKSYYALTETGITEQDKMIVKHPEKGVWIVEKK